MMDLGLCSINTPRFIRNRDPIAAHSDHEYFSEVPDAVAAFTLALKDDVYATCTTSQNTHLDSYLWIVSSEGILLIEPAFYGESTLKVTSGETTIDVD